MNNIFAINKPVGLSSNQALTRIKKKFNVKKVGHAGTLDPLASGVLVVAVGREYTKQLPEIVKKEKEYLAAITLGQSSSTDDEEGIKTVYTTECPKNLNLGLIETVLKKFSGPIEQIPPIYSAIKIKGQAAYKLARQGQAPIMKSRVVEIKSIELLSFQWPILEIKVLCDPGTYIRSLARDIGQNLGTQGYLSKLVRTRVGQFNLDQAQEIDNL